jgi:hypothetical protein
MSSHRAETVQFTVRLPEAVANRLAAVADDPNAPFNGATNTRSDAVRAAIVRGLPLLEREVRESSQGRKERRT